MTDNQYPELLGMTAGGFNFIKHTLIGAKEFTPVEHLRPREEGFNRDPRAGAPKCWGTPEVNRCEICRKALAECIAWRAATPTIPNQRQRKAKFHREKLRTQRNCKIESYSAQTQPDHQRFCEVCGQSPVVPVTGMCGPCTFGDASTAGGDW